MNRIAFTSKSCFLLGFVFFFCSLALLATGMIVSAVNANVDNRLNYLTAVVHSIGLLMTGGLFIVAGAVLTVAEQASKNPDDACQATTPVESPKLP